MIGLLFGAIGFVTARRGTDPLGPADIDPDETRDVACDLTTSSRRCSPPEPDPADFDPPDTGGGSGGGSAGGAVFGSFGTLLVVLLIVALVAVIGWMVVKTIAERESDEADDVDELDEDLDELVADRIIDEERPPDRWRRAAAEHRGAGRFRDAVRCEYRALVGDLARAGAVDEIPGRTSGEERQQIAVLAPAVSPTFDDAADIFDEAWFNDDEVTSSDDERFVAASRVVLDDVLEGSDRRRRRR